MTRNFIFDIPTCDRSGAMQSKRQTAVKSIFLMSSTSRHTRGSGEGGKECLATSAKCQQEAGGEPLTDEVYLSCLVWRALDSIGNGLRALTAHRRYQGFTAPVSSPIV